MRSSMSALIGFTSTIPATKYFCVSVMLERSMIGSFFASAQLRRTPSTLTATVVVCPPACVIVIRNTSSQRS